MRKCLVWFSGVMSLVRDNLADAAFLYIGKTESQLLLDNQKHIPYNVIVKPFVINKSHELKRG